jgi:hypothetical protein
MVVVSDPQVRVVSTGYGSAQHGPAVLPGYLAASLVPAALGSGRPGNRDTRSVCPCQVLPRPPYLGGTHHVLHAQLGSIEQQQLHGFVVAMPHSLMESCVSLLLRRRGHVPALSCGSSAGRSGLQGLSLGGQYLWLYNHCPGEMEHSPYPVCPGGLHIR